MKISVTAYQCNKHQVCKVLCFHRKIHAHGPECKEICHVPGGYQFARCEVVQETKKKEQE